MTTKTEKSTDWGYDEARIRLGQAHAYHLRELKLLPPKWATTNYRSADTMPSYEDLSVVERCGYLAVEDRRGGVWWPHENMLEGREDEILDLCFRNPGAGTWHQ